MPMTEMRIGDQAIRFDRDATAVAYGSLENGFAERCGCIYCKNFAAHRDLAYPPSFRALLEQLGIDPDKECEAFEYYPVEGGRHLYGGWFYLVGGMITAGECNSHAGDQFEFWFTSIGPQAPAFRGGPRLALEFTTQVKWLLAESPTLRKNI